MPDGMADATMVAFLAGLASGMTLTAYAYGTRARRLQRERIEREQRVMRYWSSNVPGVWHDRDGWHAPTWEAYRELRKERGWDR